MENKKVVLVTGSSSGFGRLIVEKLGSEGHEVFASMRDIEGRNKDKAADLERWSHDNHAHVHVIELDVTSDESVQGAVDDILEVAGKIDVVVNNAGMGSFGVNESFSMEDVQKIYDVNVLGPMRVNKSVLPHMRENKAGLLVQISSIAGRTVFPTMGVYASTKFAIEALSETYRYELAHQGVDSVIIEPGGYPTDFFANVFQPSHPETNKQYGPLTEQFEKTMGAFMESLSGENGPNPKDIADAVSNLMATPTGERPLRTVVSPDGMKEGAEAINNVSTQVQGQMMEGFGLSDHMQPKAK